LYDVNNLKPLTAVTVHYTNCCTRKAGLEGVAIWISIGVLMGKRRLQWK